MANTTQLPLLKSISTNYNLILRVTYHEDLISFISAQKMRGKNLQEMYKHVYCQIIDDVKFLTKKILSSHQYKPIIKIVIFHDIYENNQILYLQYKVENSRFQIQHELQQYPFQQTEKKAQCRWIHANHLHDLSKYFKNYPQTPLTINV